MPNLVYTKAPFVPFTKIISADVNTYFSDIKSRVNWAGGTDTATGLGDTNIQSNTASGGGLTRSSKLKAGTANYVIVNNGSGLMSEASALGFSQGGTGLNADPTVQNPGDVFQVNATSTAITLGAPTGVPASLRLFTFRNFS